MCVCFPFLFFGFCLNDDEWASRMKHHLHPSIRCTSRRSASAKIAAHNGQEKQNHGTERGLFCVFGSFVSYNFNDYGYYFCFFDFKTQVDVLSFCVMQPRFGFGQETAVSTVAVVPRELNAEYLKL